MPSLLPNENIKIKFFISELQFGAIKIDQAAKVGFDSCVVIWAGIRDLAPQAEYASPLIYSKENCANVVFLIEAKTLPELAAKLHPGQLFEVRF